MSYDHVCSNKMVRRYGPHRRARARRQTFSKPPSVTIQIHYSANFRQHVWQMRHCCAPELLKRRRYIHFGNDKLHKKLTLEHLYIHICVYVCIYTQEADARAFIYIFIYVCVYIFTQEADA